MAWKPSAGGPKNLRELYHWVWRNFTDIGAIQQLTAKETAWASESATKIDTAHVSTTNQQWTEIWRETVPENTISDGYALIGAKRTDALGAYRCKLESMAWRDTGALQVDSTVVYELGATLFNVRAVADGNNHVVEVRGRNNQDWDWDIIMFFEDRN